jgi:hypothetical protein
LTALAPALIFHFGNQGILGAGMTQISAAQRREDAPVERPAPSATVQRLVAKFRYEPPKVVSFPIDSLRVTEPVTLAGNG